MPERQFLVSVDVDSLDLYLGLYGHTFSAKERHQLVAQTYTLGVRRFLDLFDSIGIQGLFFIVGQDLQVAQANDVAEEVVRRGHMLGNHTWSHPYRFIRLGDGEMRSEVENCERKIRALDPETPAVFRAPGYNMTRRSYDLLESMNFRYDSSPLPSYPYLMIKYSVLAYLGMRGRKSQSIWGNPSGFLGSRKPHKRGGLTVLPCATTPGLRLPIIGTTLSTAPTVMLRYFLNSLTRSPFVGLEFHAVDLMEREFDQLHPDLESQRDLAVPLKTKEERFSTVLKSVTQSHRPLQLR